MLKRTARQEIPNESVTDDLNDRQKEAYEVFLSEIRNHLNLSKKQNETVIRDFNSALKYLLEQGTDFEEALRRLDPGQLGGFYVHPALSWYPLDNAAIIYPLSMKFGQMPVFRLSVYLKQDVIPEILQMALNFTIKRFPSFATTIKSGFFWHYLDSAKRRFSIEPETSIPCKPIPVSATRSQSFRVMYFNNRISVEFFHVLTDGTGGMIFLKTLLAEYLRLLGHEVENEKGVWDIEENYSGQETRNEFAHAQIREGAKGFMGKIAVQMSGKISDISPCQIIHFDFDSEQLRNKARQYGTTVTSYMLGQMNIAAKKATEDTRGSINIQVPVNMRKYNGSNTIRNYSMYFSCVKDLDDITTLEEMLPDISQQVKEKSSLEEMGKMMSTTIKLVQSLKYVPLIVKKPFVQIVYGFLGDKIFSSYLSNLGVMEVPDGMKDHVEKFDFLLGPSPICRASCTMVTYGRKAVFTITKITKDPTFEETLLALLQKDGLEVEVTGSDVYAG